MSQYEETMTKLTEYYRQRAKKHWATQGDRNTSYFHNAVIKRRRRNRIVSIRDAHGNIIHNPDDIAAEFVNYFKNIFHSTCANNDRQPARTTPRKKRKDTHIQYRTRRRFERFSSQ
jgi:hypothetical protein